MAKVNGLQGVISGKLGNTVFRNRYGKTIAAQYQPNVENRRTEGQVAQREKFKMLNQLAALFAGSIAIPRVNGRTGRNQFVSLNQRNIVTVPNTEIIGINATAIQLTNSLNPLGSVNVKFASTQNYNDVLVEAVGAYTDGYGHLAVATRPERTRKLYIVVFAVPTGSSDINKIIMGATSIVDEEDPTETAATYTVRIALTGFELFEPNAYTPVALAYEITEYTEGTNRRYNNTAGAVANSVPYFTISSLASNNFTNADISATLGTVITDAD